MRPDGIHEVPIADVLAQTDLLFEHWSEIALNKTMMVLAPDHEKYATLERAGLLLTLGAYASDKMVGYSTTLIATHLHYSGLTAASNDALFLRRSHRAGTLGMRLIRETEAACRARGAKLMMWHAKQGTALDLLMQRKGYGVQDIIYSREL